MKRSGLLWIVCQVGCSQANGTFQKEYLLYSSIIIIPRFLPSKVPPEYFEDIIVIYLADFVVNRFMGENIQLPEPHNTFFDVIGHKPPLKNLITDELISNLSKAREFVHSLA